MKKIAFIGLFLLAGMYTLSAQIEIDAIFSRLNLVGHPEVQSLKTGRNITFRNILANTGWEAYDSTFRTAPEKDIWIKFQLENTSKDTLEIYVYSRDNYTDVYFQNGSRYEHYINGFLSSLKDRQENGEHHSTEIRLAPLQQSWCYIKLKSDYQFNIRNYPVLYSRLTYLNYVNAVQKKELHSMAFIYTYLISLVCTFIFALVFCLRLGKKIYFYYLGYVFFQIIYAFVALRITPAPIANFALYIPLFSHFIFEPVQFLFIGFYIFFILHLLEIKKFDLKLSKVLSGFGIFCFAYALLRFIFNFHYADLEIGQLIFNTVRMIVLPINFVLFFWIIYKVKHPLLKYFILGQGLFFTGAVLSSYISFTGLSAVPGGFFNFPHAQNIIFQAGLLGEVFCFSIAIGENVFLIQRDKENSSKKLIDQLQQNRVLQDNMRIELDLKINEKTEELIHLYSEIEKQKEAQIKKSFSERLKNMEMLALRSQMNPHFIFNSLNALKNLVMMSREEDAIQYLDNFSFLLRTILQNSNKDVITVEEELEILELYLSLEKSRLGENFTYTIHFSSREKLSQYTIPPLLLQPFVENAIWHGLRSSYKPDKMLTITFDTAKQLKITIEDNGVGRLESGKSTKLQQSMGTNIIKERLSLYNHINNSNMQLNILDLKKNGIPMGTRITITYNN